MTARRPTRTTFILAAALLLPASAAVAQSCLGTPLAPSRHSLGVMYSGPAELYGPDDAGAIGLTYAMQMRNQGTVRAELNGRSLIAEGSASTQEDFSIVSYGVSVGVPVLRVAGADPNRGWCGLGELRGVSTMSASDEEELGRAPSPTSTVYSLAAGIAYAMSTAKSAFYAGPKAGIAFAENTNQSFINIVVGAGTRLGPVILNGEVHVPVHPDGGKNTFDVRVSFPWGRMAQ